MMPSDVCTETSLSFKSEGRRPARARLIAVLLLFAAPAFSHAADWELTPFDPNHMDASMDVSRIDVLYLLPIADIRLDKSDKISLQKMAMKKHGQALERMGYEVEVIKKKDAVAEISEDDLADLDPGWIRELGPAEARWIMLWVLEDLADREKTYGGAHGAECSGYFFDKQEGKMLWQHQAIYRWGLGGVAGLMFKGMQRQTAVAGCAEALMVQFPTRNDKQWYEKGGDGQNDMERRRKLR
jgi:hypothetical protein